MRALSVLSNALHAKQAAQAEREEEARRLAQEALDRREEEAAARRCVSSCACLEHRPHKLNTSFYENLDPGLIGTQVHAVSNAVALVIPDAAPGQIVFAASLSGGEQAGAAIACACTHVSHACNICRHAKEEAEKKEREERQKRQEELRQKRKVALAHCKCLSSFTTSGC